MQRNYKKEYQEETPLRKKQRSSRNKARRKMSTLGKAKKGDGKDVHHRDGNPLNNSSGNLTVLSKSKNQALK
tara:strand:- start:60 stop:275 length:216 start_codon:yes stop_codon:yes gene_type:complete